MYEVGDRVKCIKTYGGNDMVCGLRGTIVSADTSASIGVKFDENIDGHDCGGRCSCGFGWYLPWKHLELIEEPETQKTSAGTELCEWCEPDSEYVIYQVKHSFSALEYTMDVQKIDKGKIKYCPLCGRKLEEDE